MDLLQKLVNALGPSGNESTVRNIIMTEIKKHVNSVQIDKMGNLICHKKGKGPKVMLAAHMDEIGLMTRNILDNGRIRFVAVGGIEPTTLIAQRVSIVNSDNKVVCTGVITHLDLHEGLETQEDLKISDLYVDCGLTKKELEKLKVTTGCFMIPKNDFSFLGNTKIISGKSLDNRVGCYVLLKLAQKLKDAPADIYFVFTVQEEIGLYGAQTSVYTINPDWAVAVDTTSAEDGEEPYFSELGKGPCITLMDVEIISNRCLNDHILSLAKKNNINIQQKVEQFGTTDAAKLMLSRGGVPATTVSVALRNIHSTVTIAHTDDIKDAINLLYQLMKHPPKTCMV